MFERRLKIFLSVIFALAAIMVVRAAWLQVFRRGYWQAKAEKAMQRESLVETPRGQIWDRKGVKIAYDVACIDAAVDFRAISLDPEWIKSQAAKRLPGRNEPNTSGLSREQLLADEIEHVKSDIDQMWVLLADASGKTAEEIEETREEIRGRVVLLQRNNWYRRFAKASGKEGEHPSPWYERWLVDARTNSPDQEHESAIDAASVPVGEQTMAHVILANIDAGVEMKLRKKMPRCPGL
jgi:cell division protein FtsI/penicillin-binding protein 2